MTRLALLATLLTLGLASHAFAAPNILLIVADDLGWRDVGYHGSEIRTPHLDALAKTGVRLERNYVYPTCSPTRAGLFTGRNPSLFGIHGAIGGRSTLALPKNTMNLARLLNDRGYTTALFGKWHLGLRLETGPRKYGFERTYGYLHGQIDQYTHIYKNGDRTWHRDDVFLDEKGHATDLIAGEAVRFIQTPRKKPFFLWLAFSVPHYPVQEEEKWLKPYEGKIKDPSRRLYAASVTHMDDAIGRVTAALEKASQLENTLIVFTSDNGGQKDHSSRTDYGGKHGPYPVLGDNRPWRGWKTELYEGGIRVPALVSWKGKLPARVVNETVSYLDWFPTLGGVAGAKMREDWRIEGRDVWPLLSEGKKVAGSPLYWNTGGTSGVLDGDWKLIVQRKGDRAELYNLADDPAEKKDLASEKTGKVEALRKVLAEHGKRDG